MKRKKLRRKNAQAILLLCAAAATLSASVCAGLWIRTAEATAASANRYVLSADALPTLAPTPEPTVAPSPTAFTAVQDPEADFSYLPVIRKGNTDRRQIAITVDDCYQPDNLAKIAQYAEAAGGRLTLFPIGENVSLRGMPELLRDCVFRLGFEIENHTWSHARIFRLSEAEMAAEIWKQQSAVSAALGVAYQPHFFRLMGGDGENDPRTHNYLEQLGYLGIADWSLSGSDAELSQIAESLAPGKIYLFHTTDADTEKLRQFIPYAVSQGYELVTLNELLGLKTNAMSELSSEPQSMPSPQPYRAAYQELRSGDYSWSVVRLQRKLMELGYLSDSEHTATRGNPADGVYGSSTAEAVLSFQKAHGLPETGVADAQTQRLLLEGAV